MSEEGVVMLNGEPLSPPPPPPPPPPLADDDNGEKKRSAIISALVQQVKNGELTRRDLFNELSNLNQGAAAATPTTPSLLTPTTTTDPPSSRGSFSRRGNLPSSPTTDAPPGKRHSESTKPSKSPTARSSDSPPPKAATGSGEGQHRRSHTNQSDGASETSTGSRNSDRISGFSSPDRRAFIQRLIEEKRKARMSQQGSSPGINTSSPSPITEPGRRSRPQSRGNNSIRDQQQSQSPPTNNNNSNDVPRTRPSTRPTHRRPSSAPRQGRSSQPSIASYVARASMDDLEIMKAALQAKQQGGADDPNGVKHSFKPKIKELPRHYGSWKDRDVPFHERVTRWQMEKEIEVKRLREENEIREVEGCTFHPTINPASRRAVESARLPHDNRNVNERLYDYHGKLRETKERMAQEARQFDEEKFKRQCTFKPNLRASSTSRAVSRSRPSSPRPQSVTPRYLSSPARVRDYGFLSAGLEQCTFRPSVNRVPPHMEAARVYLGSHVVDRLTRKPSSSYDRNNPYGDDDERIQPLDVPSFLSSINGGEQNTTPPAYYSYQGGRPSSAPLRRRPSAGSQEEYSDAPRSFRDMTPAEREERRRAFNEFLARQTQKEIHKRKKIQEITSRQTPVFTPKLCKLSMAMLQGQDKGSFLERMQRDALKKEHMAEKLRLIRETNDRDCTFRPEITKKSLDKPARSAIEMSRGDMLRRETNQRLLKLKVEKERFSDFTFRPNVNYTSPHHHRVRSKLGVVTDPDTYIERLHREAKRKADLANRMLQEREMAEVAECTFKPKLHDCPNFIKRIARSLALTRSSTYNKDINEESPRRKPDWR